jgi:hypothetical protein
VSGTAGVNDDMLHMQKGLFRQVIKKAQHIHGKGQDRHVADMQGMLKK